MNARPPPDHCPCGKAASYADCCRRYHTGETPASAETLMRSRYSAYTLALVDYLLATWHPDTRPAQLDLSDAGRTRWLGLDLRAQQQLDADHATVEFVARYRLGGAPAVRLHEISRFERVDGRWFYRDGEFP